MTKFVLGIATSKYVFVSIRADLGGNSWHLVCCYVEGQAPSALLNWLVRRTSRQCHCIAGLQETSVALAI